MPAPNEGGTTSTRISNSSKAVRSSRSLDALRTFILHREFRVSQSLIVLFQALPLGESFGSAFPSPEPDLRGLSR